MERVNWKIFTKKRFLCKLMMMCFFWTAVLPEYGVRITYGNIYKLILQYNWLLV